MEDSIRGGFFVLEAQSHLETQTAKTTPNVLMPAPRAVLYGRAHVHVKLALPKRPSLGAEARGATGTLVRLERHLGVRSQVPRQLRAHDRLRGGRLHVE